MNSAQNTETEMNNSEILDGADKFQFLKWLRDECVFSGISDEELNHICNRWVEHKRKQEIEDWNTTYSVFCD